MDQKNGGPTVFDINRPQTYGATPSARPIIVGHQPTMPDPMVTPQEVSSPDSSKIDVRTNNSPDFPTKQDGLPSAMDGGPQPSPSFKPQGDGQSAKLTSYMPMDIAGMNSKPASDNVNPTTSSETVPKHRKSHKKLWLLPLLVLILLAGAYAAIDKGLILSNINLPYHIFKNTDTTASNTSTSAGAGPSVPSGFTATKLVEANLAFAYPTAWGAPTASTDQGYSARSSSAKADVSYAFIINFPNNKDVQLVVTSGKYLPPARTALYYDFLGWCVGSADSKYYAGILRFSTTSGVDSPSTVTCDQGPLNNVTKLTSDTIVQTNIKASDGSLIGDIYTKNLTNNSYAVMRAKDATSKNGTQIQTLLGTVQNIQ